MTSRTTRTAGRPDSAAADSRGRARSQGRARAKAQAGEARDAGRRVADHPVFKVLARAGFAARGLLYILIGWIAVQVAFGDSGQQADRSGALQLLGRSAAGEVALWLLVIGFFGMALWRLSEVFYGPAEAGEPEQDKRKAVARRLLSLGKVVVYAVLGYSVLKYAVGRGGPQSSDTESVDYTARLLQHPGGQVLVAVIGVALVATGAVLAYQAWKKKFLEALSLTGLPPQARSAVEWLGRIGGIARGAVFVTAGVFMVVAAVDVQPGQAKGVDSALRSLAGTPGGPWLLVIVALGLIMFGVFSWCEARWRRV